IRLLVHRPCRSDMHCRGGNFAFLVSEAVVLAALLVSWQLLSGGALTESDWTGFLMALTPLALSAMAQTIPILAGGQGLAVGATIAASLALPAVGRGAVMRAGRFDPFHARAHRGFGRWHRLLEPRFDRACGANGGARPVRSGFARH